MKPDELWGGQDLAGPPTREDMQSRYTERARRVFELAREEALRLGHARIGCVHLLLALVREGEGIGYVILLRLGVDPEALRARLESAAGGAGSPVAGAPDPEFEPSPLAVAESAIDEALALNHQYVGSEHLLLALTKAGSGVLAATLTQEGVDHESARRTLKHLFGE